MGPLSQKGRMMSIRTIQAIEPQHLVGVNEIAALYGVDESAVRRWRRDLDGFPQPVRMLSMGHIFDLRQVAAWLQEKGLPDYHVAGKRRGKLTPVQRQEIITKVRSGECTQAAVAREYGISQGRVSQLMSRGG